MTNTKKGKYDEVKEKTKKIVKAMKVPSLTKDKVEKYISTQPINVMTTTLQTKSVDRLPINWTDESKSDANKINQMKNWYSYYQQIENNLVIGAKAIFVICRDLYDASRKLSADDFDLLKSKVHLSEATISKYMKIGQSTTCQELFQLNKLPESWTTMYKIAQVKDNKQIKAIKENITLGSTNADIDVFMGVVKQTLAPLYNYDTLENPKDFETLVSKTIKEFNSTQKAYFLSKEEKPVAVEVACNKKLLQKVYKDAYDFIAKNVKGKDKNTGMTETLKSFMKVKQEIDNPVLAKLGA